MSRSESYPLRRVVSYYVYKATSAVEFYRPIMYLYFASQGLGLTGIMVLEALYNVTTVLGEIPTGYLGDRVGRRDSLLVGTVIIAVTLVGLGFASGFPAFAVLYVCWSLGYTFRSGTEDAWVYETLVDTAAESEFTRVRGRGQSIALVVGIGASAVGGYLGSLNLAYPFFAAAGVTALGAVVLTTLDEPETYEESESDALGVREMAGVVSETLRRPHLRAFVLYYFVLFSAVTYLVSIFVQPVFENVDAARRLAPGFGDVETFLGVFYAAANLLSALLNYRLDRVRDWVGLSRWFRSVPFLVGAGLVATAVAPVLAVPAFLLTQAVVTPTRALAAQFVNDRIETLGRATVLSAMSMASGLTVVPFQLGSGALADATSPLLALAIAGGLLVAGAAAIVAWEDPVPSNGAPGGA